MNILVPGFFVALPNVLQKSILINKKMFNYEYMN